jgi:hypothetical protein
MNISAAAAEAMVNALAVLFDGGTMQVRTGARPATVGTAASGTLLGTLTFDADAFDPASSGSNIATAIANAITQDSTADNTGTIGYVRALNSSAVAVADLTVGTTGSGADIEFDTLSVIAGGVIDVTALNLTLAHLDGL